MLRVARTVLWLPLLAILTGGVGLGQEPKKVTRAEALSAATSKVQPEYPAIARQFKVEGVVELEAVIADTGKVDKVNILSGNAMLTRAAAEALKAWKFTPFTEDGKPVRAVAPISFMFKM